MSGFSKNIKRASFVGIALLFCAMAYAATSDRAYSTAYPDEGYYWDENPDGSRSVVFFDKQGESMRTLSFVGQIVKVTESEVVDEFRPPEVLADLSTIPLSERWENLRLRRSLRQWIFIVKDQVCKQAYQVTRVYDMNGDTVSVERTALGSDTGQARA